VDEDSHVDTDAIAGLAMSDMTQSDDSSRTDKKGLASVCIVGIAQLAVLGDDDDDCEGTKWI
jgi:hypothetical protein